MLAKTLFIFDMDGVLIESEPYWRTAQITVLNDHGKTVTAEDCIQHTMGKRLDDIAATWIRMLNLDIPSKALEIQIMEKVIALIHKNGEAIEGISDLILELKQQGLRLALASSSSYPIIEAVAQKLGIEKDFELMLSADEVVNGKPAPDVYLETCLRLQVPVEKAIALEDSLTGVRAAVAAEITTIAIPYERSGAFEIADFIIESVCEVQSILKEINASQVKSKRIS